METCSVCPCACFLPTAHDWLGILQQIPENTYRKKLFQSLIGKRKSPEGQTNRFRLRACRFVFT